MIWFRGNGGRTDTLKRFLAAMQSESVDILIMPESIVELINGLANVLDSRLATDLVKVRFFKSFNIPKNQSLGQRNLSLKGDSVLFKAYKKKEIIDSKVSYILYALQNLYALYYMLISNYVELIFIEARKFTSTNS